MWAACAVCKVHDNLHGPHRGSAAAPKMHRASPASRLAEQQPVPGTSMLCGVGERCIRLLRGQRWEAISVLTQILPMGPAAVTSWTRPSSTDKALHMPRACLGPFSLPLTGTRRVSHRVQGLSRRPPPSTLSVSQLGPRGPLL